MAETLTVDESSPGRPLTTAVPLDTIVVLVNPLSGGVGANAVADVEAILADYPVMATVVALAPDDFDDQLDAAFDAKADALFVLAGDGTAGTIAARAGPEGPLVAPLPGGTMNMLPKALYGTGDWKEALRRALETGTEVAVAGGRVVDATDSRPFFCAAILGAPALWAPAREAVRTGRLRLAWLYGLRALRRAFSGRLRYTLVGEHPSRTEALVLISPTISRAVDAGGGLEAAAMNTTGAAEAFRLAAHALFDDWRHDPAVRTRTTRYASVSARSRIPAVIDGEPTLLDSEAEVIFDAVAFRALAPAPEPQAEAEAGV
jgi:diacylglycerol kinase family enzyme